MTTPPVPRKPVGKFYAVILRHPEFSHANVAVRGGLGGSDVVPVPDLGAPCVCCNGDTAGRTQTVELTSPGGRFHADPVEAPVCLSCAAHATERTGASIMAACLLCVGIPLSLLGFFSYEMPEVGLGGALVTVIALAWIAHMHRTRLAHTGAGHFPGLSLLVAPRQCVVRTPNRELAERVVAKNAEVLFRVR